MGAAKNATHEAKDNGKHGAGSRGSVDNASRLAGFADKHGSASADWGGCDPIWIQSVVVGITGLGGAVTFGTSRDGGAFSLTLMLDGERETLWFNGDAELDAELELVNAKLEAMT